MGSINLGSSQLTEIRKVVSLLEKKDQFRLLQLFIVNTILAFLDLIGVALIGITSAVLIRGLQAKDLGDQVSRILEILNIETLPQRTLLVLLGSSAIFFFIIKTIISMYLFKKTLRYLSFRTAQISSNLVSRMFNRPVEKIFSKSIQHQLYNVTWGVEKLINGVVASLVIIVSDSILLIVMLVGLAIVDPITSIATFLLFTIIAILLYNLLHKRVEIISAKNTEFNIYFNQKISEGINSFRELFMKGGREYYVNQIKKSKEQLAYFGVELKFIPSISKYTIEISVILGIALLSGIQFYLFEANRAIAVVSVFLAASTRIAPAIIRIQQNTMVIKSDLAGAKPTFELIKELDGICELDKSETKINTNHEGFLPKINLRNLNFKYQDANYQTINNISLNIVPGKFIAFVGPSGGGKSTLVDIILGLLTPTSGSIFISDLSPVESIKKWPGSIGYVPQEVFIENSTVKENICLGFDPKTVSDQLVWNALELADISEFVEGLDGQLSYKISDAGKNLSGGQRQRLGIARALLTKPKIVIFDEATSALDAETENRVSESIMKLTGDCTVIFIAHRLSVVRSADMIYYLDKGKIINQGTFEELRKLNADFNNQANFMGI
jgi:ABC-type multidrug transport system fused ATPase/permease subunit